MLAVLLLLLASGAGASPRDDELEACVRALDGAREPGWTQAFERLTRMGAPAAARVLSDFEGADHAARRARARLLLEIPAPADCARVLALLGDPDPEVRRAFARWLGDAALAEAAADERVRVLEELACSDPDAGVRGQAVDALAECALPQAVDALERLLERLAPDAALAAAGALARLPAARERLIARVTAAFGGAGAPRARVLAELLSGYGRALAAVPGGGLAARERLPFLRGRTHPVLEVQVAARVAQAEFVARCAELLEPERADQVLARLAEEGWPPEECLRRRLDLAWLQRGDPAAGLELARALERVAQGLSEPLASDWETHARFFQGAALVALGQLDAADALFAAEVARLEAARARRTDLFPSPAAEERTPPLAQSGLPDAGAPRSPPAVERSEGAGVVRVAELELCALAHQWRALIDLARGRRVSVLSELRAAHQSFLEARAVAARADATDPSLDTLFEHQLSPYSLVLFNDELAPAERGQALDRALALAADWATVAPLELPGFEPGTGVERRVADQFADPARLEPLRAVRAAEGRRYARLERLLHDDSTAADRDRSAYLGSVWEQMRNMIARDDRAERAQLGDGNPERLAPEALRAVFARLTEYLVFSMHAHALAQELRNEGRAAEARTIAERALATLRTSPVGRSTIWVEWNSARFELLRGSTFMDEERPREAEEACLAAVRRLEAIERSVEEMAAGAGPEAARQRDAQVQMVRRQRSQALLSLAVNSNVRFHDTAKALEYFERAYDLDQSADMRVLRACYRARSGKADEARAVLRGVVPVPGLYYNMACTYSLMGEKEAALDYLERDFRDNYPTAGARQRQREWARKDPDLASLRGEARFARLLGDAEEPR